MVRSPAVTRGAPGHADDATTALSPTVDPPDTAIAYALVAIEGPDEGKRWSLDGTHASRVFLGQSPACEIRLSDRLVSRRHAALDASGQRLRLADLGSTNGTFVDGIRVVEVFLRGGEVVRVGSTAFRVDTEARARVVQTPTATRFGRMLGESEAMRRIYPLCERLAASDVTVVIEGETGTGKEVLAESLHEQGPRAAGPFVVFDCTAVAPSLVESALFGHERGAFTGAVSAHRGVFEQADGGTLLIDEIGDLDGALQPKLLRVLERGEVRRVGSDRPIGVAVRVLAATRRDLDHEVQAGRFRDDLFFRLAVARIELPPLRARGGDVTALARHFWRSLGGGERPIPYELLLRWEDDAWPGNVRELHNAVARQIALGGLELAPLDPRIPSAGAPGGGAADALPPTPTDLVESVLALDLPLSQARQRVVDDFERRYVERVLAKHGGSVVKAAAASGIARRYFQILRARTK
jgi:transcriptional regulator with GAF, ATPase, and Fis domain